MNSVLDLVASNAQDSIALRDFVVGMLGSVLTSFVTLILYRIHYAGSSVGASVFRMFMLGGPSITALLLAIQFSLPLSLGLLGALSIIRFRTPVKDPAEIGYLLLLIAGAIGCATLNLWLVLLLYLIAVSIVLIQILLEKRLSGLGQGYILFTFQGPEAATRLHEIRDVISRHLKVKREESVSVMDGRSSLQYRLPRSAIPDWGQIQVDLERMLGTGTVEISARTSQIW